MQWLIRSGTRDFVIRAHTVVVGRGRDVDLALDHQSVSRRHAQFRIEDGAPTIEDLQSRNGTVVNGRPIAGRARLSFGDRVLLGSCELELLRAGPAPRFAPEHRTAPVTRDALAAGSTAFAALDPLRPRERDVFRLVAQGLSQRDIAERLSVSVKTVETYRTRIGHKLGLRSRAQLIRCALEAGILRPATPPRSS
jgi:DNA-binding CsgD family transcriptional regulator